jgi:Mg-chelatase subunit ChlI
MAGEFMIKFSKSSDIDTPADAVDKTMSTAQELLDSGYKARLPIEDLHIALLSRLEQLREVGLSEEEVLQSLFPSTILDFETFQIVVSTLLSGNHMVLFGPPGSGKTNLAKDIWEIYPRDALAVHHCPVQDHPFSVVDEGFSKLLPPCPHCKIKYGKVSDIGDFRIQDVNPSAVPVIKFNMHEGFGFARVQGSPEVFPDNLTGTINIHKLEELGDPTSPLVLEPGKLLQANRGLLIIDEIGKLPLGTQNVLLQALQEKSVTPAKSRETYPAAFIAITTSNLDDLDNINEPLNDRLANIFVGFNKRHGNNRAIMDLALSKRKPPVLVPDIFIENSTYIIEAWRRAAGEIYELSEVGSNRTMIDNIQRAMAYSIMNSKKSVSLDDFSRGVHDAMLGRIRARGGDSFIQNKESIEGFIAKHFDEELSRAANRYWCNFYKKELKSNQTVGKKVLEETNTLTADRKLLKQVLADDKGYGEFRRLAKYILKKERYTGKLGDASVVSNIFNLLKQLDIFKCD